MSREAVIAFLRHVEGDSGVRTRLGVAPSSERYIEEGRGAGFEFSTAELRGITDAARYMDLARSDREVRDEVEKAQDPSTLVALGARRGFTFSEADLDAIAQPPPDELSDAELEQVAGGRRRRHVSFPDGCKTPTPGGPVPIPYPNW